MTQSEILRHSKSHGMCAMSYHQQSCKDFRLLSLVINHLSCIMPSEKKITSKVTLELTIGKKNHFQDPHDLTTKTGNLYTDSKKNIYLILILKHGDL